MKDVIQIAGVIDLKEAEGLIDLGIEYLGFPLRLPVNKEDHSEAEAAEIIGEIGSRVKPVLITYLSEASEIIDFCDFLKCKFIQLHGEISLNELEKLKALRPDLVVFKSLVIGEFDKSYLVRQIETLSPLIDAFITDTFDPKTGASGATGKVHDWSISREFVQISPKPVILAGGLNADNVYQAILAVKPAGVDSHTGVEEEGGRKCLKKSLKFIREARRGFAAIRGSSGSASV